MSGWTGVWYDMRKWLQGIILCTVLIIYNDCDWLF